MISNKTHADLPDISPQKAALFAGLGLLIMAILAIFANLSVLQELIVPKNAAETVKNIIANDLLFRIGACSLLIAAFLDVVVAWALYIFLKPINKSLSLIAAWLRVVYAAIFAIAINNLFSVLQLFDGANYLAAFKTEQLNALTMLSLKAFDYGWLIGLVFFGFHLFVIGLLIFKSDYIPKVIGILLIVAGLGYVIDSFAKFILPGYDLKITMYTFIGEVVLLLWLLIKGTKQSQAKS